MGRIVHLGLGNFHRAHQAVYTQDARGWQITGVSLRSPATRDALAGQDGAYTLAIKDADGTDYRRMDVIDQILVAPENPNAVVAALAAADIVTITVTEKGYHLADGTLDLGTPALQQDLAGPPGTIYGLLAHAFRRRRAPLPVISCDNLAANGPTLRAAMTAFLAAFDPGLARNLDHIATFPATMVDRITPATTDALRAEVAEAGLPCAAPVETEAFTEWVIEDFAGTRPDWSAAGATFVSDVAPHELRKLRMLNGAHSFLAYAGTLAGFTFVHQAIADPALRAGARRIMDEASATLPDRTATDAPAYAEALIRRFENPSLNHRLRQIAMDGSQKLPQRMVATWGDRDAMGLASPGIEAGLKAWVDFVAQETRAGRALDDPLANDLARAAEQPSELLGLIGAPFA